MSDEKPKGPWPIQFAPQVVAEARRLVGGLGMDTRLSAIAALLDDATADLRAGADQTTHPGNVAALAAALGDVLAELRQKRKPG